jgi:hypothetical protein
MDIGAKARIRQSKVQTNGGGATSTFRGKARRANAKGETQDQKAKKGKMQRQRQRTKRWPLTKAQKETPRERHKKDGPKQNTGKHKDGQTMLMRFRGNVATANPAQAERAFDATELHSKLGHGSIYSVS